MNISHLFGLPLEPCCYLCGDRSTALRLICEPCWGDLLSRQAGCYRCGCSTNQDGLCAACLKNPGAIDSTTTLGPYQFPLDRLLLSLKYRNKLLLARELGRRIADKITQSGLPLPDYIVPVPLHAARLFGRGYNQSLEISRAISVELSVPISFWAAKRIRYTQAQFNLKPEARRRNVRGAFVVNKGAFNGPVAIIDDIVTTGNTANELALQLRAGGATSVQLWACAHAG